MKINEAKWDSIRNWLIPITALMMILTLVFQAMEIDKFAMWPMIQEWISSLFG